jgi:hypothetical protein
MALEVLILLNHSGAVSKGEYDRRELLQELVGIKAGEHFAALHCSKL